jgi:hypothetical protein
MLIRLLVQCGQGARASLSSSFAISQLVLDIVTDLMSESQSSIQPV